VLKPGDRLPPERELAQKLNLQKRHGRRVPNDGVKRSKSSATSGCP